MSPWIWGTAAVAVAYIELHAPGFYLIWIAAGAGVNTALPAVFGLAVEGQLLTFAVASAVCCIGGHFVYQHLNRGQPEESQLNRRELQIIGAAGVVCEPLKNGHGKVRLGDSVWLAEGPSLPEGAPIVVTALRGTTVRVEGRRVE
jgi:inner membrane protein